MTPSDPVLVPSVAGQAIPAAAARYFDALARADHDAAAAVFTPDALHAVPSKGTETQPRVESAGGEAIAEHLAAIGSPTIREVQLCVVDGANCLIEGVERDGQSGDATRTFVAAMTMRSDDMISRYLEYSCRGARQAIPTDADPAGAGDALVVVHRYFDALDSGAFEEAAACFSERMLYSHPPYRHTGIVDPDRVEFCTGAELVAAFIQRGRQTFGHEILTCVQSGRHAILEGIVFDLPAGGTGSFISSLSLDDDDRIERYVSFYCEPSVPQR